MLITENLHGVTAIETRVTHFKDFTGQTFIFRFEEGNAKEITAFSYSGVLSIMERPTTTVEQPDNPKPLDTTLQP